MSVIYGYIYVLTNKINNKKYVGQTTRTFNNRYPFGGVGAERMYNYHLYMMKNNNKHNKHLLNAFEKYGLDNFIVDEEYDTVYLINGDYEKAKKELDDKEKYYIKLFNSMINGYNKTTGGTGEYSVVSTFKPNYELKTDEERVIYVYKFLTGIYNHKTKITQKQIDNISNYLYYNYNVLKNINHQVFNDNCYQPYQLSTNIFYQALIDNLFYINSYMNIDRKRGQNGYYKEPKWVIIDENKLNENNNRKEYYKKITQKQLLSLKEIETKKMRANYKAKIRADIRDIEKLKVNDCNIRQSTELKYYSLYINDKLKNNDIKYTKDVIRKVLKNWIEIENESEKNPYKTISCIKMDFENVFNKIKLTDIQQNILDDVKKGIVIDDGSHGNFQRVIEKIYKQLNKN